MSGVSEHRHLGGNIREIPLLREECGRASRVGSFVSGVRRTTAVSEETSAKSTASRRMWAGNRRLRRSVSGRHHLGTCVKGHRRFGELCEADAAIDSTRNAEPLRMQSQVEVVLQQLLGVPVRHPGLKGSDRPPREEPGGRSSLSPIAERLPEAPGILLDAPISLTDVGELSCWTHVVLARFCPRDSVVARGKNGDLGPNAGKLL